MKYKGTDKILVLLFCVLGLIFSVQSLLGALPENIQAALLEGAVPIALLVIFYFKDNLMCGALFILVFIFSRADALLDDAAELWYQGLTIGLGLVFIAIFTKLFYAQKEENRRR